MIDFLQQLTLGCFQQIDVEVRLQSINIRRNVMQRLSLFDGGYVTVSRYRKVVG
jgi:hypothetical protein